ncbi:MAG: MBL fold metallo-hydrolase [Dehalococcoidia bacterium]
MSDVRVSFLGTGAGNCIHRAHTAIALDCADNTRLLLDVASGNSVLRFGAELGMLAESFEHLLLSHRHADHMSGLPHLQGQRTLVNPDGPPLQVHSTEVSVQGVRSLFRATSITHQVDQDGVQTQDGRAVVRWNPVSEGQWVQLGDQIKASCFAVDHIGGAVGWRVESDGVSVVFSGDTRYCENLAEAAQGAHLLIHEALSTDHDKEDAARRGHSTAGEAARIAALAGVSELVLTHIDTPFHFDPQPLVDEARQYFDGPVSVASDLYQITVGQG